MKIGAYQILILVVLIVSVLVIGLRGTLTLPVVYQNDSKQDATSIQGIGLDQKLWADNFTSKEHWVLATPDSAAASLQLNGTLTLGINFTLQASAQAVSISRSINLTLDQNPIVTIQTTVSTGVHYGVRFTGITSTGNPFDAWRENLPLQHRPGQQRTENISANLQLEAYLANNHAPFPGSRITEVLFYVEANPGTEGHFSMEIASLEAFAQRETMSNTREISGSFQDISISLDLPLTRLSLFQAFVSFDIRGTSNLRYIPFLVSGGFVLAQGFTYLQTGATLHQDAVLLPQLALSFPPILPSLNSTEILLGSTSGRINYFKLDDLTFKYTSTPIQAQGLVDPKIAGFLIGFYFLFLFVTPITAIILLTRAFKSED